MENHSEEPAIPYSERELIQRAINSHSEAYRARVKAGYAYAPPRWFIVKNLFGTGQTVSRSICEKYGFDPDLEIG